MLDRNILAMIKTEHTTEKSSVIIEIAIAVYTRHVEWSTIVSATSDNATL